MTGAVERALSAAATAIGGARVVVAFSGGRDSTVLLHAAAQCGTFSRVRAWHVNHHLHAASDEWQRHCEAVSAGLGVECRVNHVQVSGERALEGRAREERYRVWRDGLDDGDVLLLAHHLDDQVETVLWRLVRGSGTALLRGMPQRRALGKGTLLRPLLDVAGSALAAYASAHGLTWIEDPANADHRHDRSFLRTDVVPRLVARFPQAQRGIAETARALDRDAAIVGQWLDERLVALGATADVLPVGVLAAPHAEALLRQWLVQRGVRGVSAARLGTVVVQASAGEHRSPAVELAPGIALRRYRNAWRLVTAAVPFAPVVWSLATPLELPHGRLIAERHADGELSGALHEVTVRMREAGDALTLAHRGTHRLKQLFQRAAIPPWERATYPIVTVGDEVAMVPGIGVAARYAANGPGWRVTWEGR
jgi:tRNA(Ile)-lysidine synthase